MKRLKGSRTDDVLFFEQYWNMVDIAYELEPTGRFKIIGEDRRWFVVLDTGRTFDFKVDRVFDRTYQLTEESRTVLGWLRQKYPHCDFVSDGFQAALEQFYLQELRRSITPKDIWKEWRMYEKDLQRQADAELCR